MATPISPKLAQALRGLRRALGVADVVTDGRDTIWVLSGPRTLRRGLTGTRPLYRWLFAAGCKREHGWMTIQSYLDNAVVWDGWESAINLGLGCLGLRDDWTVLPVPAKRLPRKVYSAARGRWLEAGPRPRFRFCDQPAVPFGHASGPVLLDVANDLPPLMLTHGVSVEKMREVRKCRGFLWPSWGLSWRVPQTYGDVIFFGSTLVVTDMLRPSGRAQPSMYLAGTDIWSPDARQLALLEKSIEWELSGDRRWWIGDREREEGGHGRRDLQNDLLVEGLSHQDLVSSMAYFDNWRITEPLKTRRALVRRMRALFRVYADPRAPYAYPERDPELRIGDAPYPYGELKVMGRVGLGDIPLVVYPARVRRSVERTLDGLGFEGFRMRIPYAGPLHADADDAQRREYAALVTSAVLRWADAPCHTVGVDVPDWAVLRDSWRSRYDPRAMWIVGRKPHWARGYCGAKDPGAKKIARMSRAARDFLDAMQRQPGTWGLERAIVLDELDDPDLVQWATDAETSRFRLSVADAKVANSSGWFRGRVEPGAEVVVLRLRPAGKAA